MTCTQEIMHSNSKTKRISFPLHEPLRCFGSLNQWEEWTALRGTAASPCEDCTPAYHERMQAKGKCEHHEVIFIRDSRSEDVFGINRHDHRYARVLLGMPLAPGVEVLGRTIDYTESWHRLFAAIRKRSRREVSLAIDVWQKRYRALQKETAKHTDLIETHHA